MLDYIIGAACSLLFMAMLWTCKNSLSGKSFPVAVEPFECPRCGYIELAIVTEEAIALERN